MRASILPAAVLGLGLVLSGGIREQRAMEPSRSMSSIDSVFLGQVGRDVEVPAEERRVAGMSDYMMRAFGADSSYEFSMYVGYYNRQVQGQSIHSPKNCLPGAGWEILESKQVALPGGDAGQTMNRVLLANKGVRALVVYWYQGRGRIESSEYVVKWNLLRDAAVYGRTEESLVRLVIPLGSATQGADASSAMSRADSIVTAVAPALSKQVSERMPAAPSES